MSTFTDAQIQDFGKRLQVREQQLQAELKALSQEQAEHAEQNEDMPREPDANQSTGQHDREVRQAEKIRDQQELRDVQAALQRIADGSYGECTDCGKNIAPARLEAFMSAKRCIQCQTAYEANKR